MKTIARAWGFRAAALLATAAFVPACGGGSSGGLIPSPGSLGFLNAVFTAAENGATATITVRRSGGTLGAVSVSYATSDGSATAADYTTASGTLNWANGDGADKTFTVTLADDAGVEGVESVRLTLSLPGGGASLGLFQAFLSITDDDAPAAGVLQFSAAAASVSETGGTITVTVSRSGGSTGAVGVTYSSANGGATAGADYTAVPGASTLSWADGDSADKTFTVPILDDAAAEGDETFILTLSLPTGGATLGTVAAQTVTILDSDSSGSIQLSSAAYSVAEAGVTASITLTRTGGSAGAVGVTIASANGTATAGADYVAIPAATTVNWGAGDVADKTVFITISSDLAVEGNETVLLTISAPTGGAALGGTTAATLTLIDDDTTLQLSSATYSMAESGPVATITVTRLGSFASPVSVQFATSDGTATAPGDYTAAGGPLTWAAGDGAAKTFDVPLTDDAAPESDETVNLTLSNAAGLGAALGAQTTAVLTILDNDVTFTLSAAALNVGEAAGPLGVTVTRVGAPSFAVSVDWTNPAGGTATGGGADYTAVPATLNFIAGDTTETFNVGITSDPAVEPNETFNLALANPTIAGGTAVLGTPNAAVVTIADDDINFVFSSATYGVAENSPAVTVTVRRLGLSAGAVSVFYNTTTSSAGAGTDYTAIPPTQINWADGDTADKTFNVTIIDDSIIEGNEDFNVVLSAPSGGTLATPSSAVVTITENDVAGTLQFSSATYSVGEAGPTATITVTRTGGVGNTVTAVVSTANDTATAGSDYTALNGATGLVTFPAGSATAQTVSIPITDDILVESSETVDLSLGTFTGGATAGAQSTAELTILDNDVTLQFTSATHSVSENGSSINIPVSRVGRSTGAVSVSWNVNVGSTAATPTDFTAAGTLSWADGDTANKNITVTIVNDVIIQGDLTVILDLATPVGVQTTIGAIPSTTLTIQEDDAPGTLQFTAANFNVNEGTVNAQVTLSRTGGTGGIVSVDVTFPGGGTASTPADFTVPGAVTVTWAAGDGANKTFNIPILADALSEGTETIALGLTNNTPGTTIGAQGTSQVSILDAPGSLSFSSSLFSVGEAGPTATITVNRVGGRGGAVGATWTTSNGSAVAPGDYTSGTNTLSWADGDDAAKQFNVPVVADTAGEGDETFGVALSLPTGGAAIGSTPSATVTIVDDDTSFRFSSSTYSIGEAIGPVVVTVQRLGVLTGTDTVQWSTSDGPGINPATSPADYTGSSGNILTFNPSDVSQQFTVPIVDDLLVEGNKTFTVVLSNPSGSTTIISPSSAVVTITEDDLPGTLALSSATYSVNENVATATITVTRTGGTGGAVAVNYATSNGTAQAGSDYATASSTLNWAAGDGTSKTFDITITNDGASEGNETVNITLSGNTGGTTLGQSSAVLTINDDDSTIVLSSATYTVNEGGGNLSVTVIRTNSSVGAVTATVATSNGTASAGSDYTATSQNVTWLDGDSVNKTVLVPITDDAAVDPNETINLTLTIFSGNAVVGTPNTAVATITDNEAPSVVSVTPLDNATGVRLDANVVITFSEAMNTAATEAAISFARNPVSSPLPTAAYSWSAGDTVLTIVFDTVAPSGGMANIFGDDLLTDNTTYTVTVGVGATGAVSLLPMAAPFVADFTTILDATPPSVTSITPSLTAPVTAGGASTVLTVVFNEPMNTTSGQAEIEGGNYDGRDSVGGGSDQGGMTVAWANSTTFTITVAPGLPARTGFRLQIYSISDLAGNGYNSSDLNFVTSNPTAESVRPIVSGTLPAPGATGVSRDAGVAIGFSELLHPDVVTKVTIGGAGAGVPVEIDTDADGLALMFIQPLRAWGIGTVTIDINCAAGTGATDLRGNRLTENVGSVYRLSFTTIAGANDATALAVDTAASGIKNAATRVTEGSYEGYFQFVYASTTTPAYPDRSTLAPRDVSLIDQVTGLPVKGYRIEGSGDSGALMIQRFAGIATSSLALNRLHTLRLNTTLRTTRGTALGAPLSFTFTTRGAAENAAVQIIRPPEIEVETFPSGEVGIYLSAEIQNPDSGGQTTTVTVTAPTSFSTNSSSGSGTSFFNFNYETPGSDEANLARPGPVTFTFSANDDGGGTAANVVTGGAYVFNPAAELTATQTGPPLISTPTPTYAWSWPGGVAPSSIHAVIIHVEDVTDPNPNNHFTAAEYLVSRDGTSFATPSDMALPTGRSYRFYLGCLRFKDPNSGGGVTDLGIVGPRAFSVP